MKISKISIHLCIAIILLVCAHGLPSEALRNIDVLPGETAYYCPDYGIYKQGETAADFCSLWVHIKDMYQSCKTNDYSGIISDIRAKKCHKVVVKVHTFNTTKCYVTTVPTLYQSKSIGVSCSGPDSSNAMNRVKSMYK